MKLLECKRCGTEHLFRKDGKPSACANPQCLIETIAHTAKKGKKTTTVWQMICAKEMQYDCAMYVAEELIKYCNKKKEKGIEWYPVINWHWLRFKLLNYIGMINKHKAEIPQENLEAVVNATTKINKDFIEYGSGGGIGADHPEKAAVAREVATYIEGRWGNHWALYYMGALTMLDLVKIEGRSFSHISPKVKKVRADVLAWAYRHKQPGETIEQWKKRKARGKRIKTKNRLGG